MEKVILAGGCFWGMQDIIRKIPGVINTRVGYTGGSLKNPTYNDIKKGNTGHAESIEIEFDQGRLSFATLLEKWFFRMHDPTTVNQQGNDRGSQYRSAIFYGSPEQKEAALAVIEKIQAAQLWPGKIVTEVTPASEFYLAEDYHQDYLEKNPNGYTCHYLRPE